MKPRWGCPEKCWGWPSDCKWPCNKPGHGAKKHKEKAKSVVIIGDSMIKHGNVWEM